MILGLDGNEANTDNRVGVGWYTYYLLHEFKKIASPRLQFRIFLKKKELDDLPKPNKYFQYFCVSKRTIWSQIDLPLALYLSHRDLSVFLSPAHYSPLFCPCPRVVVVHDLGYFYYPQDFLKKDLFQLLNWTSYSVKKAKKIIAVSNTTKDDVILNYKIKPNKIKVISNGFIMSDSKESAPQFKINSPFFLYIGTLQPRKNLNNLILGFRLFLENYPNYYLYIVGKKGWLYDDIYNLVKSLKLTDRVVFTDYLRETEKKYLLNQSEALVMPGLYEGFGLPLLEAFSSGVPIISSNTGALPEVAGSAACYFDPVKPVELSEKMAKIITDKKLVSKLTKEGKSLLKNYSWQRTAKQIINACLQTLDK